MYTKAITVTPIGRLFMRSVVFQSRNGGRRD
jgi:hypothetical protein